MGPKKTSPKAAKQPDTIFEESKNPKSRPQTGNDKSHNIKPK